MLSYLIADNRIKKVVWSNLALNWVDKIGGKGFFFKVNYRVFRQRIVH